MITENIGIEKEKEMKVFEVKIKNWNGVNSSSYIKKYGNYISTNNGVFYFFSDKPQDIYDLLDDNIYSIKEFGFGYTIETLEEQLKIKNYKNKEIICSECNNTGEIINNGITCVCSKCFVRDTNA